jgi:pimeloyl-ACP methyl ester carboxylesterase
MNVRKHPALILKPSAHLQSSRRIRGELNHHSFALARFFSKLLKRFEWLERELRLSKFPTLIDWGREDDVFEASVFGERFKKLVPHAEGPELVRGRHFLQEDSSAKIADLINSFLDRIG